MNVVRCAGIIDDTLRWRRAGSSHCFLWEGLFGKNGTDPCYVVSSAWPYCSFVSLQTADGTVNIG